MRALLSSMTLVLLVCLGGTSAAEPPPEPATPADETPPPAEEAPVPEASPPPSAEPPEDERAAPSPSDMEMPVLWSEDTWDLMVELGGVVEPDDPRRFYGRVRGGWLWIRYPWLGAAGGMVEVGPHALLLAGVHGEFAHIGNGLWVNGGGGVDLDGHLSGSLGVGWSFFGAEARLQQTPSDAVVEFYGKLRLPLRLLIMAFSD